MRRSRAPSQIAKNHCGLSGPSAESGKFASTQSSVLRALDENSPKEESPEKVPPSKRTYNVVYGKQSKKKHKTWEGDGFLVVGEKSVILKDSDGKVLGQSSHSKTKDLEEGSRLFVGSKEVEILDLLDGTIPDTKKRPSELEKAPCTKKTKLAPFSFPSSKPVTMKDQPKPFTLPRPDDEHQWIFNLNHLPVTDVVIDSSLTKVLRQHQKEGIAFLYRCVTGIRSEKFLGAILADEMGLGKTLQCVALVWTLLRQGPYGGRALAKRVLVVVPSSLVQNWKNEFTRWIGSHRLQTFVVDKKNKPQEYLKYPHVPVLIISYEMFLRAFEELRDLQYDLIICDEGHRLKNNNIRTTMVLNELDCKKRIILTGTPIQNDLQEFFALANFVNPGILGSPSEFRKTFEDPIVSSRDPKACEEALKAGSRASEELNRITNGFILRRTQSIIDAFLPQKYEYVVFCEPSQAQKRIYRAAVGHYNKIFEERLNSRESVAHLSVITALKKICNHPVLLRQAEDELDEDSLPQVLSEKMEKVIESSKEVSVEDSSKLEVVEGLLKSLANTKERVVLVSNFTKTLDLLGAMCDANQFKYARFDGSTPTANRSDIVSRFNSPTTDIFVLLLSSKAGGVGLNLIGGSRLVLFDSDWNPATDIQAMARIWREGQKRHVHIYRLLTSGTIEEKIYQRQLNKAGLNESVVDTRAVSSVKLSTEELKDLFSYEEAPCLTHDMLKCGCLGSGEIPSVIESTEPEDDRDCRILLPNAVQEVSTLRINQLYQWEHHRRPMFSDVLQGMGLEAVGEKINFIFRNRSLCK